MIMICNRIFPSSLCLFASLMEASHFSFSLLCYVLLLSFAIVAIIAVIVIIAIELLSSLSEYYLVPSMHPCII